MINGRKTVLESAAKAVLQDRNKSYGNPKNNFKNIANFWHHYFKAQGQEIVITSADVANLMVLVKIARLSTNLHHLDSLIDIAGYAACGADCIQTGPEEVEHFVPMPPSKLWPAPENAVKQTQQNPSVGRPLGGEGD